MNLNSTRNRLAVGLACIVSSVLLICAMSGVVPDQRGAVLNARARLCEVVAINSSLLVNRQELQRLEKILETLKQRHPDILSAGVRRNDGRLAVEIGSHVTLWNGAVADRSIETHVQVPIYSGREKWGSVELCFEPLNAGGIVGWFQDATVRFIMIATGLCFLGFVLYLRKMLSYLDPAQSVPGHVRSALDSLAEGLLVVDGHGRIVLANQSFASLLALSPEKLLGRTACELPWGRAPEQTECPSPWLKAVYDGEAQLNVPMQLNLPSGEQRSFSVNCSPVLGHDGKYRGALVSFEDVTVIESQKAELERSRAAAEAASQAKSSFLANMSHEIRTPMNAILGFTDVLRRGLASSEHEQLRYLDTIHSSGEHLLNLLNDILDLSKVEAGRFEVEQIACRPHEVIREVLAIMAARANEKNLTLRFETPEPLPETIQSDPMRLRQIVTNLVGNAIKFTKTGGVSVVARCEVREQEPRLIVDVVDTGCGIPAESLAKVFDPFTQADSSTTRKFGGTGLGLTISRRFAEAMRGSLTVDSELGVGSCFTLTIPTGPIDGVRRLTAIEFERQSQTASLARTQRGIRRLRAADVLVVDDGEANRQLITLVLTRAGLRVTTAENGQVAVDRCTQQKFDVILMDMQMPVLDGYQATRILRNRGVTEPIVALTGNAMKGDEEKCKVAGCSHFISKPVNLDRLMELLSDLLGEGEPLEPTVTQMLSVTTNAQPTGDSPTIKPRLISSLPLDDDEFRSIVIGFVDKLHEQWQLIEQASRSKDWQRLHELTHWLKGAAGTVGFPQLTEPARLVEQLAKSQSETGLAEAIKDLGEWVAAVEKPTEPAAI